MTTLARLAVAIVMSLFASSCMFDVNFGAGKKGNGQVVEESREITGEFTTEDLLGKIFSTFCIGK